MTQDEAADPGRITDYHMHVYYDPGEPDSRERAERLREMVQSHFAVRMGRWHDAPVGPHPISMYQIQFEVAVFPTLVPFVMLNRMSLTILLHPQSGRPRDDHTLNAVWMGEVLPLNTAMLAEQN